MWKRLAVLVGVVAAIALFIAIRGPVGLLRGRTADDPPIAGRPECPRHKMIFVDSSGTWVPRETAIAGSGLISVVPEYHDCQRLKTPDRAPRYGPLVAIFARIYLKNLPDPPGFVPPSPAAGTQIFLAPSAQVTTTILNNAIAIHVPVPVNPKPPAPDSTQGDSQDKDGTEHSVATILNYDEEYKQLAIPHGFSCLYVHHSGATWAAELAKVDTDADCLKSMDTWPNRVVLNVRPTYDPDPPPVARWDWDEQYKEHFIGIECGSSWCEVWNPTRTTPPSSPANRGMGKGWYDEQYLAEKATVAGHPDGLLPGPANGAVLPIGDLASYEAGDGAAYSRSWIPVARVWLSENSPAYEKKYKYDSPITVNLQGSTIVSMCKGTAGECGLNLIEQLLVNGCDNKADPWWARIESPKGTKYRCVIRRKPDPGTPLAPGIVRWRWKLKDEGMWIRCPGGCCEKT